MNTIIRTLPMFLVAAIGYGMDHFAQIPDFEGAYTPERVVMIPFGETVAMPSGDIDLLWIEGTCVAPRDADLSLKVREIVVAPGGVLDMGSESDPVLGKVTVTFADGEFTADDPTQWGHGLLVFGDFNACGQVKPAWTEGAGMGEAVPMSGDALSVMDQLFADLENTITFTSENIAGTRGHIIITDDAECAIQNVSIIGMGRTKPEPLGAGNLIGRYPLHFHHSMGANRTVKDVVVDGVDYKTKWGIVVHHSSWVNVTGCLATRCGGAGFVTEDGAEVGNKFQSNLAYSCKYQMRKFPVDVKEGFTGAGFWFKSMVQHIDDNVSVGNSIGFQSAITAPDIRGVLEEGERTSVPRQSFQSSPGGPMDGTVTGFQTTLSGKRNRFVDNRMAGFDCWGSIPQTFTYTAPDYYHLYALPCQWEDCLFAYNGREFGGQQVIHSFTQCCMLYSGCTFIGWPGRGVSSVNSIDYQRVVYFDGCDFQGAKYGLYTGRGTIVANCTFGTDTSILVSKLEAQGWPYGVTFENNTHAGIPYEYRGTDLTVDDIKPHEATLAEVYQNVDEYRMELGGTAQQDDSERQRILNEIEAARQQINTLQALITKLEAELYSLGGN